MRSFNMTAIATLDPYIQIPGAVDATLDLLNKLFAFFRTRRYDSQLPGHLTQRRTANGAGNRSCSRSPVRSTIFIAASPLRNNATREN